MDEFDFEAQYGDELEALESLGRYFTFFMRRLYYRVCLLTKNCHVLNGDFKK